MRSKNCLMNLMTLVVFIMYGFLVFTYAADKEKSFNVSKGDRVEIISTYGNINVTVWSKDQAYLKAVNVDENDLKNLTIEQTGKTIKLEFKGKESDDFYIELSIPMYLDVDLSTGGGNIKIDGNISGKIVIATGGGNIKMDDAGERLSVSTAGGNISVGNVSGSSEIASGGGSISIGNLKSNTSVSTAGGNVSIGNIESSAEVSTAGGNISVGKISGDAELSTAGGNIILEGATGKVEVNTAGGNINLKNISGSIEANTAGGNIYAELNPTDKSNSEFNTASGDITLKIPVEAKVSIVASVYVNSKLTESEKDNLIRSDFEAVKVDLQKNNLIKKYVLNGGGAVIELNSGSGKIKINKK